MVRIRSTHALQARQGVILLVVITLLTLFAVVGITFVIYAQAEASSMRAARQAETLQLPDADPELLLAYYLNQLIYDTNNPNSAMRNWSLANNMYGAPGNTIPFNGLGRLQGPNYWNLNYAVNGNNPANDGAPNPPYTYPDVNSLFLAGVRGSDGAVLIPSFYRNSPNGPVNLRAALPFAPEDGVCDVKNLPDSPGLVNPQGGFTPNDSVWMDLGFPVMVGPDGRAYKALFAALIQDLDNRVNVNAHGNILSDIGRNNYWCISHQGWSPGEVSLDRVLLSGAASNWEVSHIFNGNPNNGTPGRYDQGTWPPGGNPTLADAIVPGGHFYSGTDIDCWLNTEGNCIVMPQGNTAFSFPWYNEAYSSSWSPTNNYDKGWDPIAYNYFDPTQNWYWSGGFQKQPNSRRFPASDLEALARYSDTGSPALTTDLFLLCPNGFSNGANGLSGAGVRRLVTTLSMDLARAGIMPAMPAPQQGATYQLAPNLPLTQQFPALAAAPTFPAAGNLPTGEFGTGYRAMTNTPTLNRIDLNRGFVDYPATDATSFMFTNAASYQLNPNPVPATGPTGMQSRQQMAQEIFNVFCAVTGASATVNYNPATGMATPATINANPGTPEYDALRYLAQLAVNIVDYTSYPSATNASRPTPDDVMTCFNWNNAQTANVQNGWVFGTVLPRLVLNEAYVEIVNQPSDVMAMPPPANITKYDVNCWVELHDPFSSDAGSGVCNNWQFIPTAYSGWARLWYPASNYAGYRVIIAQKQPAGGQDNTTVMTQNNNVQGVPQNIQAVVDNFVPDTPTQPLVLTGDSLNKVQPINNNGGATPSPRNNNVSTTMLNSQAGGQQGFFVLGPKTPFPGTDKLPTFFATYPVKEGAMNKNDASLNAPAGTQSSMHYVYTSQQAPNVQNLNHTLVLQRLACPYMPPNFNPQDPNFNPYVTVDYMLSVPTNNGVTLSPTGQQAQPTPVQQRFSVGRNQPYAADQSQQVNQTANYDATKLTSTTIKNPPPAAPNTQQSPQNTFFCANLQGQNVSFTYDWLYWCNRMLISPMELLLVSGYKPHQLTQMFVQGPNQNNVPQTANKFMHRAAWFNSASALYRALEFFEAGLRPQWSPIGGRFTGRININTIWDQQVFNALCDSEPNNYFTQTAVDTMWTNLMKTRTPNGVPQPGDRPFLGMAGPYAAAGNPQYPNGADINDTFLRADPNPPANNPQKRLFEANYTTGELRKDPVSGQQLDQIFLRDELMIKIFGNTTTRSNTFALWLTVGFFEVTPTGALGQELNKAEGRNVRHRMFAVLDRTNLTLDPNNQGQPGPRPFFINSLTAVPQAGAATITVPASANNMYEEMAWSIQAGNTLVVDTGANQETVAVTGVAAGGGGLQVTATFVKPHKPGFAVSNAVLGNPGPQAFFDPRNPQFGGIVRYFSIIQ